MDLARRDEFVPQIPIQPDAQPNIFFGHAGVYPMDTHLPRDIVLERTAIRVHDPQVRLLCTG